MSQPLLFSLIDKAVFDYELIKPGDRILTGASGGKDSTALIEYLSNRKKRPGADFDFLALNIQSEISGKLPEKIRSLFEEWSVPFDAVEIDVQGRLKSGKKMSCYWCSTQRRTELIDYAIKNGFNKICLGHHMDDILETLLMNTMNKAEFSTMPPKLKYEKYPVEIIRPLCYVQEKLIVEHAKEKGYYGYTCTCNFQDNSARKEAKKRLSLLTDDDSTKKEHLFWSLKNIQKEYLP